MNRFAAQWESYVRQVLAPVGAGEVQIVETRRAFYSGAVALRSILFRDLGEGAEPSASDLQLMEDLEREFDAYAAEVARDAGSARG